MDVAVLDLREKAAWDTAAACQAEGTRALALGCDVSIAEEMEAAAETVRTEFGPVSLIWANAGVNVGGAGFTTATREELRWMYAVNVEGMINTILAFVPAMTKQSGWRWVGFTGSLAGFIQLPDNGPSAGYAATKYACVGIAEGLRAELAGKGIGVTIISPSAVNTRIWDDRRARPERFGGAQTAPEEKGERWRTLGLDVGQVASIAVDGMRRGDFHVVIPRTPAEAEAIERRHEALVRAIRFTPNSPPALCDTSSPTGKC